MNSAPRSTIAPSPNGTDQTRPPTRSRASSTVTLAPPARSASAAARPAKPAPTTTTRVTAPPPPGASDVPGVAVAQQFVDVGHGRAGVGGFQLALALVAVDRALDIAEDTDRGRAVGALGQPGQGG